MTRSIENWESLRVEIYRRPYTERGADYQFLCSELKAGLQTGDYSDDDRRKIEAMLDDVKGRMKPSLGFPGGSAVG